MKQQKGFTIIEVLIVLAIAALILLLVFLVVPTLQRNVRNAGKKQAIARLQAAIGQWQSDHSNKIPDCGEYPTFVSSYLDSDFGPDWSNTYFTSCGNDDRRPIPPPHSARILYHDDYSCAPDTQMTNVHNLQKYAILYTLESGSGGQTLCIDN